MSIASLLPQTVTVTTVTAGADDVFGNPARSTAATTVPGRLDQISTTEQVDGRDVTVTRTVLYLNPDVTITDQDRVTVDGRTYEVDGQPSVVYDAVRPHHLEVPLRETTA